MSTELLHPEPLSQRPRSVADDAVDPELLALPPPARGQRQVTIVLLALVAVMASVMAFSLRGEAAYALTPPVALDVGDLYALDATKVEPSRYVHATGSLGGALAVRFERPFESDTYRVSPVMGRRNLWVEVRVRAGEEGGRYVPPSAFSGRLVPFRESGLRHRGLSAAVGTLTGEAIPNDAWLVVDGESPSAARWALGLALMFAAFSVWSAVTLLRLVRRVSETA